MQASAIALCPANALGGGRLPHRSSLPRPVVKRNLAWLVVYLVMLAVLIGGMLAVRGWALRSYDRPETREDWEAWRRQTQRLAKNPGPVARRAANSVEPPTIVLLRDHFAACLGLLLLLSSVLFCTLMVMIRGVAATEPLEIDTDDTPPP